MKQLSLKQFSYGLLAAMMLLFALAIGCNGQTTSIATTFVKVTPAITTTTYTPGFVIGGVQTLSAPIWYYNGGGVLHNVSGSDKKNHKPGVDLYLFSQSPAHGTYTNGVAYTADSVDMSYYLSTIHVLTTDWTSLSTYATFSLLNYGYAVRCTNNSNNLYMIAVSTGTFTPTTTTDLTFGLGFKQD